MSFTRADKELKLLSKAETNESFKVVFGIFSVFQVFYINFIEELRGQYLNKMKNIEELKDMSFIRLCHNSTEIFLSICPSLSYLLSPSLIDPFRCLFFLLLLKHFHSFFGSIIGLSLKNLTRSYLLG